MKKSVDDKLNETFEVMGPEGESVQLIVPDKQIQELVESKVSDLQSNVDDDYELARKNLIALLDTVNTAILNMQQVAIASENARCYEVLGELINKASDINQKLLDLSRQRIDLQNKGKDEMKNQTTNNIDKAIFMTTKELSEMMNKGNK
jgi:hypothetical protein